MAKTYIFAIGGTGSRVLKSLAFLTASGIDCKTDEIIPIIIDPDEANGDVSRTISILKQYQEIRSNLSFGDAQENKFFKTKIESCLDSNDFKIKIPNSNKKYKDFISYNSLDKANKAITSILFSEKNLNSEMEVGFKGNPNIGSVVLNQFQESEDFRTFASSFSQGDRVFIISSIFGGTGASGFPLLLKNIRSASKDLDNWKLLRECAIGAISVLPYFGVKHNDESEINKATFISKTKAALEYYINNVDKSVNQMYYIADKLVNDYENIEGGVEQKNKAHLIEFLSALAIIDFINTSDNDLDNSQIVKEFGVESEANTIQFTNFFLSTKDKLFKPLTQYYFFRYYVYNKLKVNLDMRFAKDINLEKSNLSSDFFIALDKFNQNYYEWLKEMNENERGFAPFTLNESNNILNAINGIEPKSIGLFKSIFKGNNDSESITNSLNKSAKHNSAENIETKFMNLFYSATSKLIDEKY